MPGRMPGRTSGRPHGRAQADRGGGRSTSDQGLRGCPASVRHRGRSMRQGKGPVLVLVDQASSYQRLITGTLRVELEQRGVPVVLHLWGLREPVAPPSLVRLLNDGAPRGIVTM